uniref:Uncharacterized protein n=1 Tax=Kalanchoe fedtschenkoi TaxID=63787 RepID=A0A7N0UZJ2_KALFE
MYMLMQCRMPMYEGGVSASTEPQSWTQFCAPCGAGNDDWNSYRDPLVSNVLGLRYSRGLLPISEVTIC